MMDVTLFFLNSSTDFDNRYFFFLPIFSNDIATNVFLPISAMALPQTNFFSILQFRQYYCHNFFFLPFSAMALPQLPQNFPPYFGNGIASNQLQQFFFPPISVMSLPQIHFTFFFLRNDMCTPFLQYFYDKF